MGCGLLEWEYVALYLGSILPSCIWHSAHTGQFSLTAIQACTKQKPTVVNTYRLYSKSAELFLVPCATSVKWYRIPYSSAEQIMSELSGIACPIGSHSITCHPTQVNSLCLPQPDRLVLDLPTMEGWKEGWVDLHGWVHTEMVYVSADSHPST